MHALRHLRVHHRLQLIRGRFAAAARGLEITATLEEKAFEGSGLLLLGAVLGRCLAEIERQPSFAAAAE